MSSLTTTFRPGLLHLIPVLSSTASVAFACTEYWTFLPFLKPSIPSQSLSAFWDSYLYLSMPGWIGWGITSAVTGVMGFQSTTGIARTLYAWGTGFALGHYLFGYRVSKTVKYMVHGEEEHKKEALKFWLKLHTVRTLLVDIPAMVCFLGALLHIM